MKSFECVELSPCALSGAGERVAERRADVPSTSRADLSSHGGYVDLCSRRRAGRGNGMKDDHLS